jgi:beta-mannosidase
MVSARHGGLWEIVAILIFLSVPIFALPPSTIPLHSGWRFRALNDTGHPGVEQWHPAEVPGLVQMDLLHNKLIQDPFYRDNEKSLQWIGLTDWEYQTEFDVDPRRLRGMLRAFAGPIPMPMCTERKRTLADNVSRLWFPRVKQGRIRCGSSHSL